MKLAPILIQVYTRTQHFMNCVESLSQCRLADQSHLFIVSDAPKTEKDKKAVEEIRAYCRNIKGFAKVEIIAHETNLGADESGNRAVKRVFSEYDTMIYTEDDNVFSPNFLEYMNAGLSFYNNNPHVFAICGYRHPFVMPSKYPYSVFTSTMTAAWGVGWWKEKQGAVDFTKTDYCKRKVKKKMAHLWHLLMASGNVYGDAYMAYHCLKNNMVNIFPIISLVRNEGNDGSGMNCGVAPKFATQEIGSGNEQFTFIEDLNIDRTIEKRLMDAIDFPFQIGYRLFYAKLRFKLAMTIKMPIRNFVIKHSSLNKLYHFLKNK